MTHNATLLTRPTDKLHRQNRPVLHSILEQHDVMKQIFTHPSVSDFMDKSNEADTMEANYNRLWKIWDVLQILT